MNLPNIADHIRRNPDKYRNFGPWWWSVKAQLRPHYDFGPGDDPATRELMDKLGGDPTRVMKCALRCYQANVGGYQDGNCALPDGTPYYLHDPDVLEGAVV